MSTEMFNEHELILIEEHKQNLIAKNKQIYDKEFAKILDVYENLTSKSIAFDFAIKFVDNIFEKICKNWYDVHHELKPLDDPVNQTEVDEIVKRPLRFLKGLEKMIHENNKFQKVENPFKDLPPYQPASVSETVGTSYSHAATLSPTSINEELTRITEEEIPHKLSEYAIQEIINPNDLVFDTENHIDGTVERLKIYNEYLYNFLPWDIEVSEEKLNEEDEHKDYDGQQPTTAEVSVDNYSGRYDDILSKLTPSDSHQPVTEKMPEEVSSLNLTIFEEQLRLIEMQINFLLEVNLKKQNYSAMFISAFPEIFATPSMITLSVWDCIKIYDDELISGIKLFGLTCPSLKEDFDAQRIDVNDLTRGDTISYIRRLKNLKTELDKIEYILKKQVVSENDWDKYVELNMDLLNLLSTLYSPFHYVEYIVQGDYNYFASLQATPIVNPRFIDFNEQNNNLFKISDVSGNPPFSLIYCTNLRIKIMYDSIELFRISISKDIRGDISRLRDVFSTGKDVRVFDKFIINQPTPLNPSAYETGDFFKISFLTSLKYIPASKNPIKTATEKVTKYLIQPTLDSFHSLYIFFNAFLADGGEYSNIKPKLTSSILNYVEVNSDNFFITKIQCPEGSLNVNDFHSLTSYSAKDVGLLSYDDFRTMLRKGTMTGTNDAPNYELEKEKQKKDDSAKKQRKEKKTEDEKMIDKRNLVHAKYLDEEPNYMILPEERFLTFTDFKKYLENYMVNYCTRETPSLKMITFLKMIHLNEIMVRNRWGFIDIAGGSLFNFIQSEFVVTADYDFKIYFNDIGEDEESKRDVVYRELYLKFCAINMGINMNNYMMNKGFFKTFSIKGFLGFVNGEEKINLDYGFNIETASGRYFSSRGKEPELFPVPLYSSDLFLSNTLHIYPISGNKKIEHHSSEKFCISYEDLVFKHLSKHYLFKELHSKGTSIERISEIIESTYVVNLYGLGMSSMRVPSLWEIIEDITSLLNVPELKMGRRSVNKTMKDIIRHNVTQTMVDVFYGMLSDKDKIDCPQELFLKGLCFENAGNPQLKIMTMNPGNKDSYFQETSYSHCNSFILEEIKNLLSSSITNVFNPACKIQWTMLALTKKYSDFKFMSDYARLFTYKLTKFSQIDINKINIEIFAYEFKLSHSKAADDKIAGVENSYYAIYNQDIGLWSLADFPSQITDPRNAINAPFYNPTNLKFKNISALPMLEQTIDHEIVPVGSQITNSTLNRISSKLASNYINPILNVDVAIISFENTRTYINGIAKTIGGTKLNKRTRKRMMPLVKSMKTKRKNKLSKRLKKSKRHHPTKHSTKQRKYTRKR